MTDRLPALSRRTFLTRTISLMGGAATTAAGCRGEESPSSRSAPAAPALPTPTGAAAPPGPAVTLRISAVIPGSLVFPGRANRPRRTDLVQVGLNQTSVTFQDSLGRMVTYDAAASFSERIRRRNGQANRECVAIKVLAAYVLDSTSRTLNRRRTALAFNRWRDAPGVQPARDKELDALRQLNLDFDRLQEQPVLDNVTMGALFAFLESVDQHRDTLSGVRWDLQAGRLVTSFV